MDVREVVGRNVARLRREKGLSQEQLAFEAGVDRGYLSAIESGRRNPSVLVIEKLAKALGVRLAELLE